LKNDYEIRGDTTVIFIKRRNGDVYEVLIDTEDLPRLIERGGSWCIDLPYGRDDRMPYAIRNAKNPATGRRCYEKMHRFIVSADEGKVVDHINGNTLDNRKCNLRITDQFVNQQNRRGANRNSKSGIRGVYWNATKKMWTASVMINRREYRKRFKTKEEAIEAVRLMREGRWGSA
jgi:hypothetical protein